MLGKTIGHIYTTVREALWASPLVRWPLAENLLIRLGYVTRSLLRLVPQEPVIGAVGLHKMWFSANSECYYEVTRGTWEPGVTQLFNQLLRPGMVVVDVGAHIGYFTLIAAERVGPGGKVYAFEPAPSTYHLLMKNIALNGYENIVPLQQAVSDRPGTVPFYLHPNEVGHSLHSVTIGKSRNVINVESTKLDHFFEQHGWPRVDLVKMDIEGAEPAALEGMVELLQRNQSLRIILEYIPRILKRAGQDPRQLLTRLRSLGFDIYNITDERGLEPLDDGAAESLVLRAELFCERLCQQPAAAIDPMVPSITGSGHK